MQWFNIVFKFIKINIFTTIPKTVTSSQICYSLNNLIESFLVLLYNLNNNIVREQPNMSRQKILNIKKNCW